jgi:hypothetical protein
MASITLDDVLSPAPSDATYVSPVESGTFAPGEPHPNAPKKDENSLAVITASKDVQNEAKQVKFLNQLFGNKEPSLNKKTPSLLKPLAWVGAGLITYKLLT